MLVIEALSKAMLKKQLGLEVDIVEKSPGVKWQKLPKRWIVERTFSWLGNYRRLSKDYEHLSNSEVAYIQIVYIYILLKRLTKTM